MNNADEMKRKFRSYDRLNREIEELNQLIESTEPGSRPRIAVNRARMSLYREAHAIFSDIRKEQEAVVRKNHETHDFKGLRGYGRRFGVADIEGYVSHTLRALQSYFSMGYIKGYRQALRDSGHLD